MSFRIINEAEPHKQKTMIYSLAGAGKSTLASQMDKPLFIDIEGGLTNLKVARTSTISLYTSAVYIITEIHKDKDTYLKGYQTIVIDSVDWLVRKAEEHASGVRTIDDTGQIHTDMTATIGKANGGYGNGAKQLENHLRAQLLPALQTLIDDGFAICLIAHCEQKDLLDADGYRTSRISPKIDERYMNIFVEWCDNVFYLRNDGGERKLLLEGTDKILAKNRLGKVGEVSLNDTTIQEILTPRE